ncbi:hypothetical protein D3C74_323370 [compost metagenome]
MGDFQPVIPKIIPMRLTGHTLRPFQNIAVEAEPEKRFRRKQRPVPVEELNIQQIGQRQHPGCAVITVHQIILNKEIQHAKNIACRQPAGFGLCKAITVPKPEGEQITDIIFVAACAKNVKLFEIGQSLNAKRIRESGNHTAAVLKYHTELLVVIVQPIHRFASCLQFF